MSRAQVKEIVTDGIARFQDAVRRREAELARDAEIGANPFKAALFSPEECRAQRMGRSVDSMLGNTLETLFHGAAELRYPGRCPSTVIGSGADAGCADLPRGSGSTYLDGTPKPILWSRLDREEARRSAAAFCEEIYADKSMRIGTPAFATRLGELRASLRRVPLQKTPWSVILDFWCDAPGVGFGEIKSGGELDNTKAAIEVQELLVAALISPEQIVPRIVVLYANRGEGNRIKGALPYYFERSHLLVGEQAWELVLPAGISGAEFLEIFTTEARDLRRSGRPAGEAPRRRSGRQGAAHRRSRHPAGDLRAAAAR